MHLPSCVILATFFHGYRYAPIEDRVVCVKLQQDRVSILRPPFLYFDERDESRYRNFLYPHHHYLPAKTNFSNFQLPNKEIPPLVLIGKVNRKVVTLI